MILFFILQWLFHRFYAFYTLIYKLSCVLFLFYPYVCSFHLSNYLLTWNTFLAADFFSFTLCIYHVYLRQYHRLIHIMRSARGIAFWRSSIRQYQIKFLREASSIQIVQFHNSGISKYRVEFFNVSSVLFSCGNATLTGRALL